MMLQLWRPRRCSASGPTRRREACAQPERARSVAPLAKVVDPGGDPRLLRACRRRPTHAQGITAATMPAGLQYEAPFLATCQAHRAEFQLHIKEFKSIKDGSGHEAYEKFRILLGL